MTNHLELTQRVKKVELFQPQSLPFLVLALCLRDLLVLVLAPNQWP